jgi:hypothetical protein
MRPLSTLLDRFRRGVAVPAAAGDDLAAELAPVFASLEAFETEADELTRASTQEAEKRLAAGLERAAHISSGWREVAEFERARAAGERRQRARDEASILEERGRVEADRVRARAAEGIPDLVAQIVTCLERGPR